MNFFQSISRAAIFSAGVALAQFAPSASGLNLAGSDLLAAGPEKCLAGLNDKINGGLKITFDGSLTGEKKLREGRADAALLMLPDVKAVAEIAKGEWEAVPLAFQVAVIAVSTQNKIAQIDCTMLAGIFGAAQAVDIRRWSDVPGSGMDTPIFCVATPRDYGMAVTLFRNRVLNNKEFKASVTFSPSEQLAAENALSTINSIAIVAAPPANDGVKTLAVARARGENAYKPTPSNLFNGDYPLQIPLYLVFPKKNRAAVAPLAKTVFGEAMAEALEKSGFLPVPKNLRTNFAQKLDKGS